MKKEWLEKLRALYEYLCHKSPVSASVKKVGVIKVNGERNGISKDDGTSTAERANETRNSKT